MTLKHLHTIYLNINITGISNSNQKKQVQIQMTKKETIQSPPNNDVNPGRGIAAIQDSLTVVFTAVRILIVILIIAFFVSGVRNIEQFEQAIVIRFGALHGSVKDEAGMVFALPYPIDEIIKVPAKRTQIIKSDTYWYKQTDEESKTGNSSDIPMFLKPGADGYLITSDLTILHAKCNLKYRINHPLDYVFEFNDINQFIRYSLDNALLKSVSKFNSEKIMKNRKILNDSVFRLLQQTISKSELGIEIDPLDMQLSWPRQVTNAINTVTRASQEYQEEMASANVFDDDQKNKAESQSSQIELAAHTWATKKISKAKADAATFRKLYPLYKTNPNIISQILYQDRIKKIMANVDEIFIIDPSENREIRINLPRSTNRSKNN